MGGPAYGSRARAAARPLLLVPGARPARAAPTACSRRARRRSASSPSSGASSAPRPQPCGSSVAYALWHCASAGQSTAPSPSLSNPSSQAGRRSAKPWSRRRYSSPRSSKTSRSRDGRAASVRLQTRHLHPVGDQRPVGAIEREVHRPIWRGTEQLLRAGRRIDAHHATRFAVEHDDRAVARERHLVDRGEQSAARHERHRLEVALGVHAQDGPARSSHQPGARGLGRERGGLSGKPVDQQLLGARLAVDRDQRCARPRRRRLGERNEPGGQEDGESEHRGDASGHGAPPRGCIGAQHDARECREPGETRGALACRARGCALRRGGSFP